MDHGRPIIIVDSSDSDHRFDDSDSDCQFVSSRSAPRRAISTSAPDATFPRRPYLGEGPPNRNSAIGGYPRVSSRTITVRELTQPASLAVSNFGRVTPTPITVKVATSHGPVKHNSNTVRPSASQAESTNRQVEKRQDRRCTTCIQDSRCCDGDSPCASCFEPGFPCIYPGEPSALLQHSISVSSRNQTSVNANISPNKLRQKGKGRADTMMGKNSSKTPSSGRKSDTRIPADDHQRGTFFKPVVDQSDISRQAVFLGKSQFLGNSTEQRAKQQDTTQKLVEIHAESRRPKSITTSEIYSEESNHLTTHMRLPEPIKDRGAVRARWQPKHVEEVEKLIELHEVNIKSHLEYIVEAQLAAAKFKTRQNIHICTEVKGPNPFRKLVNGQSSTSDTASKSKVVMVKIKHKKEAFASLALPGRPLEERRVAHLPEYKSIARLRSVFLARNAHTLKCVPHLPPGIEEEDAEQRMKDLRNAFKKHEVERFRMQRICLERVYLWSVDFDDILKDLRITPPQLQLWISRTNLPECPTCLSSCEKVSAPSELNALLTEADEKKCRWLHDSLSKLTKVAIWHFVSRRPGQLPNANVTAGREHKRNGGRDHRLCALCFTHNCLSHGSYDDGDVEDDTPAFINDAEDQNNERQRTILTVGTSNLPQHVCGLYCLGDDFPRMNDIQKILGVNANGDLDGVRNEKFKIIADLGPFHAKVPCNNSCFINRRGRPSGPTMVQMTLLEYSRVTRQIIDSMSRIYNSHLRLPCMISKVGRIDCMTAFVLLLQTYKQMHVAPPVQNISKVSPNINMLGFHTKAGAYSTAKSTFVERRKAWVPCSHDGLCSSVNDDCQCAGEHVHCEASCGCSDGCRRRFRGCRCKKKCFLDDRCECYAANRECNPQLCHDCGVEEVLDPSNRYRDDVRKGRCCNNRLQLDLPPRTIKAMSEVQGWGLFIGEDLPSHSFVGEYKGEKISAAESDRRGAVYTYVSQEYLFTLNEDHQLDGSRFGNKTRFINNSSSDRYINVCAKVMMVNGVTRIGLFTTRAVQAGEELLYNYGYPEEIVQGEFWEKHERATEHNGVATPIAKPKFRPRMPKHAMEKPGQGNDDASPIQRNVVVAQRKKRKRFADEDATDLDAVMENTNEARMKDRNNDDDESATSEYEESSHANDNSSANSLEDEVVEEEDEVEEESEDELAKPTKRLDRRRGGEAQRRAALTRKLNKQRRG